MVDGQVVFSRTLKQLCPSLYFDPIAGYTTGWREDTIPISTGQHWLEFGILDRYWTARNSVLLLDEIATTGGSQ
jgi:hypothetical protein